MPTYFLVVGEHPVLDLGGGDVPARGGVVEERRAATPAVGIGVLVDLLAEEQATFVEVGDQAPGGLGTLDELALESLDARVESAIGPNWVVEGARPGWVKEAVGSGERVVVLAERGGDVNQPRAVVGGDEVAFENLKGSGSLIARPAVGELED